MFENLYDTQGEHSTLLLQVMELNQFANQLGYEPTNGCDEGTRGYVQFEEDSYSCRNPMFLSFSDMVILFNHAIYKVVGKKFVDVMSLKPTVQFEYDTWEAAHSSKGIAQVKLQRCKKRGSYKIICQNHFVKKVK